MRSTKAVVGVGGSEVVVGDGVFTAGGMMRADDWVEVGICVFTAGGMMRAAERVDVGVCVSISARDSVAVCEGRVVLGAELLDNEHDVTSKQVMVNRTNFLMADLLPKNPGNH